MDWLRRHIMFWLPIMLIVGFVARKPAMYAYEQVEETPQLFRELLTCLDDPFSPVLWVLDIKQPVTSPVVLENFNNPKMSWMQALMGASQIAGVFSMMVICITLLVGAICGPVVWWQYIHDRDDITNDFPPWNTWPEAIKFCFVSAWSYFVIATILSRWVA